MSSRTLTPALRVAPNATSSALTSFSSVRARSKNSVSFGSAPGQPPSMKPTPYSSSSRATASLSFTEYEMPSRWAPSRRVVSYTWKESGRVMASPIDAANEKALHTGGLRDEGSRRATE